MRAVRPLRLAPEWDARFTRMVGVSAACHVVAIGLLLAAAEHVRTLPMPLVAYTVELTDPNALGGRLPPGAPGRDLKGGATAPTPPGPGEARPPAPAEPPPATAAAEAASPASPEPPKPAPEPKPEPAPPPPEPEVRLQAKPEAKPPEPKPEAKKPEPKPVQTKKPEPKPEPKKAEPRPQAAKAEPKAATPPAPAKAEPAHPASPPAKPAPDARANAPAKRAGDSAGAAADAPPRDAYAAAAERWRSRSGGGLGGAQDGSGPIGAGGEGPGGGGQLVGLDFLAYRQQVINTVKAHWTNAIGRAGLVTVVYFEIAPDGTVSDVRVQQGSGNAAYDGSAVRAVQQAAPLAPPPARYARDFRAFVIEFHSEERGGGNAG